MSAESRGDFAADLIPRAADLAMAVREETQSEIAERLSELTRTELEGLAVVLAAMVDPDRSLQDALGWVDFDEYGQPLEKKPQSELTIAGARPRELTGKRRFRAPVDQVAVNRALDGHSVELNQEERAAAIEKGMLSGLSYQDIGDRLGMNKKAVGRSWARIKVRARKEGRKIPERLYGESSAAA